MRNYLLLLRTNLKTMMRSTLTEGARNDKGKIKLSYILLYILAAIGMVTLAGMVIWLETALYRAVSRFALVPGMRLENLLIGLALLISMVTTLIFGLFHTLGAMYFNRDTIATAHLPIGARTQMAARWTEIYLSEMLFSLALLLPMLINHGVATHGGVGYYLSALLTLIVTPMYPLSIALLLSSVLARFTSITRNKEVWTVVFTLIMLAVVLGSEWLLLPQIPEDADALFFLRLIADNEAMLQFVIGAFPPVMWAVNAVNGHAVMLLLYAAVGVAAVVLVILLTGGSFQQVCLRHTEQGVGRKAARAGKSSFEAVGPLAAIFRRELNEVLKTPIYMMNAVLGVLMMPIMIIAMSVGMTSAEEGIDLQMMLSELLGQLDPIDLTLIITGIFALMAFMCPLTSTAISREGKRLPILKMIPVPSRTILWAKLLVGQMIISIGSLIMGVAAVVLLGNAYLMHVICAVLLANVLSCAVGAGNLMVDVIKPMLGWKSENEVMKQNLNTMFGMLISIAMTAFIGVPVALLHAQAAWMRLAVALLLLTVEFAVSVLLLEKVGTKRLDMLEP